MIAFEKLDGTRVQAEWTFKKGWHRFSTRFGELTEDHPHFGGAIDLFNKKYAIDLEQIFKEKYPKVTNFMVFLEYFGKNTFFGQHEENDKKDIILFDVSKFRQGLIVPTEFIEVFGGLDIPKVVYEGLLTEEFIADVRQNKFGLKEGVVVKGMNIKRNNKPEIWMMKIKTNEWYRKLKELYGEDVLFEDVDGNIKITENI